MITTFDGENRFLSNFWDCPVVYAGRKFKNSESAYQAAKFDYPVSDLECGKVILRLMDTNGAAAKKLAREKKQWIRSDWKQVNLGIMVEIVHAKFTQNKDLRHKLVLTYPQELIEGNNWHDNFFGVCDGKCRQPHAEIAGENWLGRILMAERAFWLDLMNKDRYKGDRLVPAFKEYERGLVQTGSRVAEAKAAA